MPQGPAMHVDPGRAGGASGEPDGPHRGRLTRELIATQCRLHHGYPHSPELNTTLYLHHLGLAVVDHLAAYGNCHVLWLNHNCIEELAGVAAAQGVRSLYLHHNAIRSLGPLSAPAPLRALRVLDVSHNRLPTLAGLERLECLETVFASHNKIADIRPVAGLPMLQSLDVSWNALDDVAGALEVLQTLPRLTSCMLHGNRALASSCKSYRRHLIVALPRLKFLDEYPVFPEERRCATAFAAAGSSGEREMKLTIQREEEAARRRRFDFFTGARRPAAADDDDVDGIYIPT